jgi:hypothetical protein
MSRWGVTPRDSIRAECDRRGERQVVEGCVSLLESRDADPALHLALAGPAAAAVLQGRAGGPEGYWPRVWAARGLLYAWDDLATPSVVRATEDPAWRVREMAAKVILRRRLEVAVPQVATLQRDPVPRVRRAAERALQALVSAATA